MIVLPSGHVVGITGERARYHAVRRGIRVTPETPHEALYPLVDIVYADSPEDSLSRRYRFTGHTLAERSWLKRWKPADRAAFLAWLAQDSQHRSIEEARRKLIYDTLPQQVHSHAAPERLFSVLRRRIMAMETSAAPAAQWRNTILNMSRCGVRLEEIRWSGVLEFLDEAAKRGENVSREEVISRVDFSPIRLELTTELIRDAAPHLGFEGASTILPPRDLIRSGLRPGPDEIPVQRHRDRVLGYRVGYLKTPSRTTARRWFILDPYGHALSEPEAFFPDAADAMAAAGRHAQRRYGLRNGLRPSDKYEFMSLHGGTAYREWLVTLPDYQPSHFTPHFTERNLLLHFRTKERRDRAGRRLLHVEEIQSDWHQKASQNRPWQAPIPQAPFSREWSLLALKLILIQAVDSGCDGISWTPGHIQQQRFQSDSEALARLYDREIPKHLKRLARDWQGAIETARIETREPWISAWRSGPVWSVRDKSGRFATRKHLSKDEAIELCARHSRRIDLDVPFFPIPAAMRERIAADGLPRFGDRSVDKIKRPLCGKPGVTVCDPETRRRCVAGEP